MKKKDDVTQFFKCIRIAEVNQANLKASSSFMRYMITCMSNEQVELFSFTLVRCGFFASMEVYVSKD